MLAGLAIDFSPLRMTSGRTFWTLWFCRAVLKLFRNPTRHPIPPAEDVFGSFRLFCTVIRRIAVLAGGRLAPQSALGRCVA